jgi:DNA-binding transcriptional MerR regulator
VENNTERRFTVGELADMVGVSVRTLQYYDQTGLLKSSCSQGGRRMYGGEDLLKLQQILFFKSLGFPLEKIRSSLLRRENPQGLIQVFSQQKEILLGQMENLSKIVETLDTAIAEVAGGGELSLEKLMTILRLMKEGNPYTFILRYFSKEQMHMLAGRFDSPEKYKVFMDESAALFKRLNELYRAGADPAGPEGQKLAKEWWGMATEFSRGDPQLLRTLVFSGRDIDHWPEEARALQKPIKNFLSAALSIYFGNKTIAEITEVIDDA